MFYLGSPVRYGRILLSVQAPVFQLLALDWYAIVRPVREGPVQEELAIVHRVVHGIRHSQFAIHRQRVNRWQPQPSKLSDCIE